MPVPHWGDRRRTRIGLLGGSFNPAHAGHLMIAERARKRLRLDQVWLVVSPGNPLKSREGMGCLGARLAAASRIADGRRVVATDVEARLGTRYTVDTLRKLRARFPRVEFVWIMGADILDQLPRWKNWTVLPREAAVAVLPRPGYTRRALAGRGAVRLRHARRPGRSASVLAAAERPAWMFLPGPQNSASATAIRAASPGD